MKDNCFTEFCCFLSNLNMNQPSVYTYPLPFEPPIPPSQLRQSPCLSFLSQTVNPYWLSVLCMVRYVCMLLSPYVSIRDIHVYTDVLPHVIASQMAQLFYKHSTYTSVGHVGVFHFLALILSGLKSASMVICRDGSVFLSFCSSRGSNNAQPRGNFKTLHFAWS